MTISTHEKSVSVITPAYNCADTITRCVESVAAQTLRPLEQIIVDDGSNDETLKVLRSLESTYDFVKVFSQSNQGAGPARNQAIEASRGRFISFLDADDYWRPRKLERQIEFMLTNNVAFSYGSYQIVHSDKSEATRKFTPPNQLIYKQLLTSCPIGCLTAVYDTVAAGKVYMPELRRGQDWALWLKLTRGGLTAHKYPGCEAVYTVQTNSLSGNKLRKFFDVFKVYTCSENINSVAALYYTVIHAFRVLATRKR